MLVKLVGTYESGKRVYCNKALTKFEIAKSYGLYDIYFEDKVITTRAYSDDAIEVVKKLLEIGIGRDYANEKK